MDRKQKKETNIKIAKNTYEYYKMNFDKMRRRYFTDEDLQVTDSILFILDNLTKWQKKANKEQRKVIASILEKFLFIQGIVTTYREKLLYKYMELDQESNENLKLRSENEKLKSHIEELESKIEKMIECQ